MSPTRCGATRNQLRQNDNFTVLFDTFHDRRNGFFFQTNPLGGLRDSQVTDEGPPNTDWNTVWDVQTARFDGGWTVEMVDPVQVAALPRRAASRSGASTSGASVRWKNEWSYLDADARAL